MNWLRNLFDYIREYRLNILVDLIDILEHHKPFDLPPVTRCPEFETMILQAHCRDTDEYSNVIKLITQDKAETNVEEERAKQIEEVLRYHLIEVQSVPRINPDADRVFIRSEVLEAWLKRENAFKDDCNIVQTVRNLANVGLLQIIDKKVRRYPWKGNNRRSGVLWNPPCSEKENVITIGRIGSGKVGVVIDI